MGGMKYNFLKRGPYSRRPNNIKEERKKKANEGMVEALTVVGERCIDGGADCRGVPRIILIR